MELFFITALERIRISEDLGRGDKLDDTTFLTNNPKEISRQFSPDFVKMAGTLEANHIFSSPAIVYSIEQVTSEPDLESTTIKKLQLVSSFLSFLWMTKDNAVNHDTGFAFCNGILHSNRLNAHFSSAAGEHGDTAFSRTELREARSVLRAIESRFVPSGSSVALDADYRLERAFYYLTTARGTSDLGIKVANYCSALEALFGSSSTELVHMLAERTAAFLEDSPSKRYEIYAKVKKAYAVRSTVVHGAGSKRPKIVLFQQAATDLDFLLRQIFRLGFYKNVAARLLHLKSEDFNRNFLLRIFGSSWEGIFEESEKKI